MRCSCFFALLWIGCAPSFEIVEREDGDRTPLSAECDEIDTTRCLLPWPSNTFTTLDGSSATGLRVSVNAAVLNNGRDNASSLAYADGFSRVTPILTAFDAPVDEATLEAAFHVVLMQHDHPERGREVSLHFETIAVDDGTTLASADPNEVLEANADYAVIVTDALRLADGTTPPRSRATEVSLGAAPQTQEEANIAGYFAPVRRLLEELEIDADHVVRAWDFTTRSAENPRAPLIAAREAAIAALPSATVEIDEVTFPADPQIAMIVVGRLVGMPTFLDADRRLSLDANGTPVRMGTTDAPFRILVPAGTGDYRFVMYGHGTGGSHYDPAFDAELAALGAAKVGVRLYGWTDTDTILTFAGFQNAIDGTFAASSPLVEGLAHAAAIARAMEGALADALSADTILSMPNPAAGRRPDASIPIWVGGSLGGTTGLVYASADPEVRYAVLNVPGAAWTQWVWDSSAFATLHELLLMRYRDDIDLFTGVAIGQTNFDYADGSAWGEVLAVHSPAILIQESIGDPILPNQGTEMVARTAAARMVGGVIDPIEGIESASEVIEASGLTQYRTAETDEYAVHGFGARDSPAGVAAREQIYAFLASAWAGSSRIAPPPSCTTSCDFGSP